MRLVLYQPDIPQNTGAMMRLAACLALSIDIIAPCGFLLDDRRLRRAGMDYLDLLDRTVWANWEEYRSATHAERLVLLTTAGDTAYSAFRFAAGDRLLVGRESGGVPREVHEAADARLVIPMQGGARSLNVALAAAMAVGEGLRQTGGWAAS